MIAGICAVILCVSWFYVFETNGMEKHEIYAKFRKLTLPQEVLDSEFKRLSKMLGTMEHGDLLDDSRLDSALLKERSMELSHLESIRGINTMLLDIRDSCDVRDSY